MIALGCSASRIPPALRGYDILVERRDPQSGELVRALREQGFRVRRSVRGGSGPTAALISFAFRDSAERDGGGEAGEGLMWWYLRLADTRTGVVLRAAAIPLDTAAVTPRARARAAVRALLAP